jgi:hypothetical protein
MIPVTHTPEGSDEDRLLAATADWSLLTNDGCYRMNERLVILCGSETPTATQVADAWREAIKAGCRTGRPSGLQSSPCR